MVKTEKLLISPTNKEDLWNSPWSILLKEENKKQIGTVSFEGEKARGTVPITVELNEDFRNKGYGTEVFRAMVNWAFLHNDVYEVQAETEHENDKCVNALEKSGFVFRDNEGKKEFYSVTKPKSSWLGVYLVIGINVGLVLAILLNNTWSGMAIGMALCIYIGSYLDIVEAKKKAAIVGKKEVKRGLPKKAKSEQA